jgi:pyridoxine 4-dehydrogenase
MIPKGEGIGGHPLSRIGLGALHLSLDPRSCIEDAIIVIHSALLRGITLIDTADCYCRDEFDMNHNERLICDALESYPGDTDGVLVATKGGMIRPQGQWVACGEPRYLERAIASSHQALGGKKPIDLWQFHVPDPKYDFSASLNTAVTAMKQGLIRWVGLSNVSLEQIKHAQDITAITSVQNSYNPWNREAEFNGILEHCEREHILFFAWSPLGGRQRHTELSRIPYLLRLSTDKQISIYALVLAWLMSKSRNIIPIPGTANRAHVPAWVDACHLILTPQEIQRIDCSIYRDTQGTRIAETRATQSEACLLC